MSYEKDKNHSKTGWDENREGILEGRARRGKRVGKQKKEGAEKVVWKLN